MVLHMHFIMPCSRSEKHLTILNCHYLLGFHMYILVFSFTHYVDSKFFRHLCINRIFDNYYFDTSFNIHLEVEIFLIEHLRIGFS